MDEPEAPGVLELEHAYTRIYRLVRRVAVVLVRGEEEHRECGVLSERAFTELEETLAALDPGTDYGYDADAVQCIEPPGAKVHIEGFEHSPFLCDFRCCRPELARAAMIYWLVETYFSDGDVQSIDGEPYVAIEPDQRCP